MAIIRSHSVAGGKKSAGMITYRHTKGRVIASQKRGSSEKSKEAFLGVNNTLCNAFALCQLFSKMHAASIDVAFESTKYGTPRNKFTKLNMTAFRGIASAIKSGNPTIVDGKYIVTPAELDTAVATYCAANPTKMYRAFKGGYETVMNTGEWDDELELTPIVDPQSFKVAVSVTPANGGSVAGAGRFLPGTPCTLTANPAPGFVFKKFVLADNSEILTNTYSFTVEANTTVRAVFEEVPPVLSGVFVLNYDEDTHKLDLELQGTNLPASGTATFTANPSISSATTLSYSLQNSGSYSGKYVAQITVTQNTTANGTISVTLGGVTKSTSYDFGSTPPVLS